MGEREMTLIEFVTNKLPADHLARKQLDKALDTLKFYAGYWGPHQGHEDSALNEAAMDALNNSRAKAVETLTELERVPQ